MIKNIQTKSGMRFPAGLAVVAIGTEPNLQLVANTPLSSPSGCPVNEYLETDEKGIYAVGDIALYPDRIYGGAKRTTNIEMARLQGLTAGANLSGRKRQKFEGVPMVFQPGSRNAFRLCWRLQHAASARGDRGEQAEKKLYRALPPRRDPDRRGALQSSSRRSRGNSGRSENKRLVPHEKVICLAIDTCTKRKRQSNPVRVVSGVFFCPDPFLPQSSSSSIGACGLKESLD